MPKSKNKHRRKQFLFKLRRKKQADRKKQAALSK
jgi:hypothetical protein